MYAPFTLREDLTGFFMESNNYQPRLVSKYITSNIDDFSVLFEESTEYEFKSGNIHSGTWAKFYRNVSSDASIVLYIQC